MKPNKDKNKKGANQKPILNLPLSKKICVQIIDNYFNEVFKSIIFQLYVKSILLNKALSLKTIYELEVFSKKIKIVIENHNIENLSENDPFMISEETEVILTILEKAFENLNLENAEDLPKFDKIEFLRKNCENFYEYNNEDVELIGMQDEFEKVKAVLNYNLFEDVYDNLKTGKKTSMKFTYKGVIITGTNGIGKTNFIKCLIREYYNKITFFDLNFKTLLLEKSNLEIEEIIKNTFKYAKLTMPSVIIMEDLDKFFSKTDEESVVNFDDKKTKLLYTLLHEIDYIWERSINEEMNKNSTNQQNGQGNFSNNKPRNKLLIISSCSNIDKIDSELRKPGNLDFILNFNPPNQPYRKKLFMHFSNYFNNSLSEEDFEILADKSHGFVPTDIIQIFK